MYVNFIFLNGLFYSQIWLLLNSFYKFLIFTVFNILLNSSIESLKWTGLFITISVLFISIANKFPVKTL